MPKIESTHLLTLSAFVDQIKEENSSVSSREAQSIILYNDFLKQEYSFEFLESHFSKKNNIFLYVDVFDDRIIEGSMIFTISDLAELTKSNPLRFKKQPYYEPIH